MDWGIVWSIMVALALFIAALMVICIPFFFAMAGTMGKKMMGTMMKRMQSSGIEGCPMPCGPSNGNDEQTISPCASRA